MKDLPEKLLIVDFFQGAFISLHTDFFKLISSSIQETFYGMLHRYYIS